MMSLTELREREKQLLEAIAILQAEIEAITSNISTLNGVMPEQKDISQIAPGDAATDAQTSPGRTLVKVPNGWKAESTRYAGGAR